jgi:aminoacyl tRNA synthase complex-interacting multifunctional protein 1
MLLCSSNADHTQVIPLSPPDGAPTGELITFEGHASAPVEPGNRATKAFEKVADDLFVDDNGKATYKGVPFMTTAGPVTSTLKGKIS